MWILSCTSRGIPAEGIPGIRAVGWLTLYPEGLAEAAAVRMWDLVQACAGSQLRYHGVIGHGVFRAPLDIPTPAAFRTLSLAKGSQEHVAVQIYVTLSRYHDEGLGLGLHLFSRFYDFPCVQLHMIRQGHLPILRCRDSIFKLHRVWSSCIVMRCGLDFDRRRCLTQF
jgi:hypothetical protein